MNIVSFVVGAVLFVGGIVLFGYAWDGEVFNVPFFVVGLLAISASIVIPFHLLKRIDG
jgi:uncharacterized protein (DUF983 family)